MLVYEGTIQQFARDVRENHITEIMEHNFYQHFGYNVGPSVRNSWQNSLSRVRDVIEIAELVDNMIALEYEIPYNQSRLDCLLFGENPKGQANMLLMELKQWSNVSALPEDGNFVETFVGGGDRIVPHPSQQVKGYDNYLRHFVYELHGPLPIHLHSCVYCHNYTRVEDGGLFDPKYADLTVEYPVYTKEDAVVLGNRIKQLLAAGNGFEIFNRFMQSEIKPSENLLRNVSKIIQNDSVFSLLNEQLVAKNLIWSKVKKFKKKHEKSVIIVQGGPGTGKSLIALNLLAEAAQRKMTVFYGCKSKSFIEGLKKLVGGDGQMLFSNLLRFLPSRMDENEIDLLLVDEAHRIERSSNFQYTREGDRTDMPQIDQLIRCSKISVFFLDDRQNVRSNEIGRSSLLREAAARLGGSLSEVTLLSQFRCMGSNDYLLWLESVLGYSDEKRMLRKADNFDFKIFSSPDEIYSFIVQREKEKPNSARMVAGFCWPWSNELDGNGELRKDVVIGNFKMPWETHDKISPPRGYVRWYEWAFRTEGVKQIGCIYTAQGFEFDYIGVIIGKDLVYDSRTNSLKGDVSATADPSLKRNGTNFDTYVKNIYRTLLSRGMKGCYVYFIDKDTERFVRSRIEG